MVVTISVQDLITELRLGDSPEELALATRRLAYASEEVVAEAEEATDACHNEACIRLSAFLYDQPNASPDNRHSNALRASGAQRILSRYKARQAPAIHRDTGADPDSESNPVVEVEVSGTALVVTYEDGSVDRETLPSGGGGGAAGTVRWPGLS